MPKGLVLATAAILAATFGLKAHAGGAVRFADPERTARELANEAKRAGYRVALTDGGAMMPLVVAVHRDCRRRLFVVDVFGGQLSKVETLRTSNERLLFHYGATTSGTFPRLAPVAAQYGQIYVRALGIDMAGVPIVAELASGDCRAAPPISWSRVSSYLKSGASQH